MNEQKRTNKIDELKKEINDLNERVKKIEDSLKVKAKEIEEKPSTTFM